ncbi:hypothetical protein [Leifsonia sp. C5G2]|uniref:hypothetical protein n=1 Tax=Leifsonia sp. C5G2 TaxID=2735269 RepID=UPI0015844D47|nr:hypothetical protein [Leifsonia sp. C5G2]NUU05011.1 hypothetical protein [Leifsonia sp. C5G2]
MTERDDSSYLPDPQQGATIAPGAVATSRARSGSNRRAWLLLVLCALLGVALTTVTHSLGVMLTTAWFSNAVIVLTLLVSALLMLTGRFRAWVPIVGMVLAVVAWTAPFFIVMLLLR